MTTPKKKPPRGPHRNRRAGHKFELTIRNAFRDIGYPHLVSSRSESRSRDAQKVDLINQNEGVNGRFPYNVQCKNTTRRTEYNKLLAELPTDSKAINVIVHKMTSNTGKKNVQGTFSKLGVYAILDFDSFLHMCRQLGGLMVTADIPTLDRQIKKNGTDIY